MNTAEQNRVPTIDEASGRDISVEPLPRLTPSEFHQYQAALERVGIASEEARKKAAKTRLLHSRRSMARGKMLFEMAGGSKHHSAILRAAHDLDSKIIHAVRGSIAALGATSTYSRRESVPASISSLPQENIVYRKGR